MVIQHLSKLSQAASIAIIAASLSACGSGSTSSSNSSASNSSSSSSSNSSSGASIPDTRGNHYEAHKIQSEPVIDGAIESAWDATGWHAIDVAWRGDGGNENWSPPSSSTDFSGRYKVMWDERQLYLLVDITDDVLNDNNAAPFKLNHMDDTVEIFIDEDNSRESFANNVSAYAYHVSIYKDVIDNAKNKNLKGHLTSEMKNLGNHRYIWEMSMRVYGKNLNINADIGTQAHIELSAGKLMGFTMSYIDNDGGQNRESFIGSVDSPGHQSNKGWQDSSAFGTMTLVE